MVHSEEIEVNVTHTRCSNVLVARNVYSILNELSNRKEAVGKEMEIHCRIMIISHPARVVVTQTERTKKKQNKKRTRNPSDNTWGRLHERDGIARSRNLQRSRETN